MTGKQSAVMWLGLLLIVLRLFTTTQWPNLKLGFQTVTQGSSGLLSSGSGFSLPGAAAIEGLASSAVNAAGAPLRALNSQPKGPGGKSISNGVLPTGSQGSPKTNGGALGG